MQWLSMLKHVPVKGIGGALVVQLLGTVDDLISPQDSIDLVTGSNFIYLDIPNSGHINVLALDEPVAGPRRKTVFVDALTKGRAELEQIQTPPEDETLIRTDPDVTDVVFVIHGIRDTGYWTQKLARRVKAEGDKAPFTADGKPRKRKFAMETSTYGYFAMLPFVLYWTRRAKVEWLMDQYVENKARYPNAIFSFVGHSNGTYLLAKALNDYPACRFEHVVFAGSVVSTDYNWNRVIAAKRVGKIYNFVATSDLVVAIFPASFQKFRQLGLGRDTTIGGAGFEGFSAVAQSNQLFYIPGGHGAAVEEKYWDEIARFIVHGEFSANNNVVSPVPRPLAMRLLGKAGPLLFVLLFALVLALGVFIALWPMPTGVRVASAATYFLVLRFVVTKV
jgi:pimeloyl-ACP methyl ester carboxylesterase